MYIPDVVIAIFIVFIVTIIAFMARSMHQGKKELLHKLYYAISIIMVIWLSMMVALRFTDAANNTLIYIWDCLMYVGTFAPVMALLIVIVFTGSYQHIPKPCYLLFIVPLLANIIVWTNPLHHLYYEKFSLEISEIVFGPFVPISSVYSAFCAIISIVLLIRFAVKSKNRLCTRQTTLFSLGIAAPLIVNLLATTNVFHLGIIATPMSFIVTVILHGFAIYRYHFFDIRPIAIQSVLDWINDCYLVISKDGLVISYNMLFSNIFGKQHGITENVYLKSCMKDEDTTNKTVLHNLLTGIESSKSTGSPISYEQSVHIESGSETKKHYYIVEVTPLLISKSIEGFIIYFKDITTVKESMQKLHTSQARMMEQERLASLGQLVAGLAHNLNTPIMSISGSTVALTNLIDECELSLGDVEVTDEDYLEIYGEMRSWLSRLRDACTYMSDIISAVKGQAKNMETSEESEFTFNELIKTVSLLLRHELLTAKCELVVENSIDKEFYIMGDINNLVQVINNLVSNAIYAVKGAKNKKIIIGVKIEDHALHLSVRDHGSGLPPDIKERLFKQMVTGKGTAGTGLGVYISNAIIRAKFDGAMWAEDHTEGGAVFNISIPTERITFPDVGTEQEY